MPGGDSSSRVLRESASRHICRLEGSAASYATTTSGRWFVGGLPGPPTINRPRVVATEKAAQGGGGTAQ
jgi:hypothetical protein